jgi:hypothetical protein
MFRGIPDEAKTGRWSSGGIRAQPNTNAPQLEQVTHLAERQDSSTLSGTNLILKFSILDIPNDDIIDSLAG